MESFLREAATKTKKHNPARLSGFVYSGNPLDLFY